MDAATFTSASADAASVVRRASLTLRDISLMRLEGCRAWHFHPSHGRNGSQADPASLFHSAVLFRTAQSDSAAATTTMGMSYAGPARVPTLFGEHVTPTPHSPLSESGGARSPRVDSSDDDDELPDEEDDSMAQLPLAEQRPRSGSARTLSELCTTCSFVANTSSSLELPAAGHTAQASTTRPMSHVQSSSPPPSSDTNTSTLAAFSRSEIDEHAVHLRLCRHNDPTTPEASAHFSVRHHDLRDLLLDRVGHNVTLTRELLLQQPPTRHHHTATVVTVTTTEDEDEDDVSSERMTPQLTPTAWQPPAPSQQPRDTTPPSSSSSSRLVRCAPALEDECVGRGATDSVAHPTRTPLSQEPSHHKAGAHQGKREAFRPPTTSFKTWRFPHFTKVISPSRPAVAEKASMTTTKRGNDKATRANASASSAAAAAAAATSHRHAINDAEKGIKKRKASMPQRLNNATESGQPHRRDYTAVAQGQRSRKSSGAAAAALPPLSPAPERGTMMEHQQLLMSRRSAQHAPSASAAESLSSRNNNNNNSSDNTPLTEAGSHKTATWLGQTRSSVSIVTSRARDAETAYQRMLEMVYAAYERRQRQRGGNAIARVTATAPGLRGLSGAARSPSLSMSGALGRSAGYYSFTRHLGTLPAPQNCQPITTMSPFLRKSSYGGASQASLATTTTTATNTTVANNGVTFADNTAHLPMDLCAGSQLLLMRPVSLQCRTMAKALLDRIERRALLQTTVFLAHTMQRCRDAGTRQSETGGAAKTASEVLPASPSHSSSQLPVLVAAVTPPPAVSGRQAEAGDAGACQASVQAAPPPPAVQDAATDSTAVLPLRLQRTLTSVARMVRHVHSIDNVEREVDNEEYNLVVRVGMRLMGWLEVVSLLGAGSFGQVFLCKDLRICDGHFVHPGEIDGDDFAYWNCSHAYLPFGECDIAPTHAPLVAVKVVKSVPLFEQQSVLEAEMLVTIGAQTDQAVTVPSAGSGNEGSPAGSNSTLPDPPPPDPRARFVAKVLADGVCYGHHCIVMERYGANLYEYVQNNNYRGLPMYQIRSIGRQLFAALSLLHDRCDIIHADIKPENLLLTLNSYRSTVPSTTMVASGGGDDARAAAGVTAATERSYITLMPGHTVDEDNGATKSVAGDLGGGGSCSDQQQEQRGNTTTQTSRSPTRRASCAGDNGNSDETSHASLHGRPTVAATTADGAQVMLAMPAPEPLRVHALTQTSTMMVAAAAAAAASGEEGEAARASAAQRKSVQGGQANAVAAAAATDKASPAPPELHIKLIDFSSSCYINNCCYTYIQSRYYRAPEVIVGAAYSTPIDLWSAGCVLAELLLGMPLLAGCSDHHQLTLIEEMIGRLPPTMLAEGVNTAVYYEVRPASLEVRRVEGSDSVEGGQLPPAAGAPRAHRRSRSGSLVDAAAMSSAGPAATSAAAQVAQPTYTLLSKEDYLARHPDANADYTRYFTYRTMQELVRHGPLSVEERRMCNGMLPYSTSTSSAAAQNGAQAASMTTAIRTELLQHRFMLFDLLRRLLHPNPAARPTATQALQHAFFSAPLKYLDIFGLGS